MSNRDVSIVFSASDKMSESLRNMRRGVKDLSSDVEQYKRLQQQVFEEKAKVKLDITQAKQSMKELTKAVRDGADGAEEAFLQQQAALEGLNDEYKRLTKLQSEVLKGEKELQTQYSRSNNANAGGVAGNMMMQSLAKAGLGNMLGGAVGDMLGSMAISAFGSTVGGAIGNIGGGAATGAAMGSIAGPIGTAVGAAVGGLTGAIQSLTQQQENMDDLYREEVQNLYSGAISDMENRVSSGSGYAAERENYKRNYMSMVGDKAAGISLYNEIMGYGDKTPYDTSVMLGKGVEMMNYGMNSGMVMEMMDMIGNIAMGDTNKFSGLAYAIAQSMNTGRLTGQDKNQMAGWGFNPLEYVAKNEGVSMAEAQEMMSAGKISADMLVEAMRTATSEGERFHDAVNGMSDTYSGMQGQLESAMKNIDIAMGEGYNEKRKEGMAREIEAYTGELGDKMKEAYGMIGAYEAEMENQYQESIIKAMEDAAKIIEEKGLEGIEAERVMWEAKTNAEIEYQNSEGYQKKLQAEKSLVENIQSALTDSGDYVAFGQAMADQFSKGWQRGRMANAYGDVRSSTLNPVVSMNLLGRKDGSHAAGLSRVPYDGYMAELHEGEKVLTRTQANQQGVNITIPKLADQIVIREDADIDRIARELAKNLRREAEGFSAA